MGPAPLGQSHDHQILKSLCLSGPLLTCVALFPAENQPMGVLSGQGAIPFGGQTHALCACVLFLTSH